MAASAAPPVAKPVGGVMGKLGDAAEKLLDLSLRNRMIKFLPSKRIYLEVFPEHLGAVIAALTNDEGKASLDLAPVASKPRHEPSWDGDDEPAELPFIVSHATDRPPEDEEDDEARRKAAKRRDEEYRRPRNLAHEAHLFEQEHGYSALFLAVGFLEWTEVDGTDKNIAPLLFYKVQIARVSRGEGYFVVPTGEEPTLNPAIQLKLRDQSIILPPLEGADAESVRRYIAEVRKAVRSKDWKVLPRAVLGMFKFHKFVMYHDTKALATLVLAGAALPDAVKAVLEPDPNDPRLDKTPVMSEQDVDERIDWAAARYVLDADPSQIVAIQEAKAGKHLVIQGPPGTGKSQSIANLIAELLGEGKRVLFVSEKEAALDVVKRRLDATGIGDFCLALHGVKTSHERFREQMAPLIEGAYTLPPQARVDANDFASTRNTLEAYAKAMRGCPTGSDIPLGWALGRLIELRERLSLEQPRWPTTQGRPPTKADIAGATSLASERLDWAQAWGPASEHPWAWRRQAPSDLHDQLDALHQQAREYLNAWGAEQSTLKRLEANVERLEQAERAEKSPWSWWSKASAQGAEELRELIDVASKANAAFDEAAGAWAAATGSSPPSTTGDMQQLRVWAKDLDTAQDVDGIRTPGDFASLEEFAHGAIGELGRLVDARRQLQEEGIDWQTAAPAAALHGQLSALASGFLFWLKPAYWHTKKQALAIYQEPGGHSRKEIVSDLESLQAFQAASQSSASLQDTAAARTGAGRSDWDVMVELLTALSVWTTHVLGLLKEHAPPDAVATALAKRETAERFMRSVADLDARWSELQNAAAQVVAFFGSTKPPFSLDGESPAVIGGFLLWYQGAESRLDAWVEHAQNLGGAKQERDDCAARIKSIHRKLDGNVKGLGQVMVGTSPPFAVGGDAVSVNTSFSDWYAANRGTLGPWLQLVQWQDKARKSWAGGLADQEPHAQKRQAFLDTVEAVVLTGLVEHGVRQNPFLNVFTEASHEAIRERFRALDNALPLQARRLLVERLAQQARKMTMTAFPGTPMGVLKHELGKKRRRKPIRQLVAETMPALAELKPCFMMSPITVATYLKPEALPFDVLIFDEASQVRPEDALVCLMRAKQVVVVGDPKQLPPTSFFDAAEADDDSEPDNDRVTDQESILDECIGRGFPERMLRWHYRSRHHSLIEGSNEVFYGGNLLVFHSPSEAVTGLGMKHHYFPRSVYGEGGDAVNRKEAQEVARLAREHFRATPGKSLGVVAFSAAQSREIYDQVYRLAESDRAFRDWIEREVDEEFFVKNLENVQGDERDHILISVGYGKDATGGPIKRRFGPVNKQGGERRLNVLFTRAKERVTVVSNFRSSELAVDDMANRGPRVLKSFLALAETGRWPQVEQAPQEMDSPFEAMVKSFLENKGYEVVPQVGCVGYRIDLAVRHPSKAGTYCIGVECDGATYHSSHVARERDRQRQEILESRLGWTLHRIWSTEWFHRPALARQKLLAAVQASIQAAPRDAMVESKPAHPVAAVAKDAAPDEAADTLHIGHLDEAAQIALPNYEVASTDGLRLYGGLGESSPSYVASVAANVIRQEAPLHIDVLVERLREAAGQARAGARARGVVEDAMAYAPKDIKLAKDGFIRVTGKQAVARRRSGKWKVEHVPPEEIDLVVMQVLQASKRIPEETLYQEVREAFGFGRLGKDVRAALEGAIKRLARAKQLTLTDGVVSHAGGAA